MIKLPKKPIRALISEVSKDPKLSLWLSLLIHIICSLQVTHLILQPTLNSNYGIHLKVFKIVRIVSSYTVGFDIYNVPESQAAIDVIWYFMCVYVALLTAMIAYTIVQRRLNKNVNPYISAILKVVYFLHPKIFFCPIHYYMVWIASIYNQCSNFWTENIQCNLAFFAVTIVIIVFNFLISLNKEMFSCEVKKITDCFAVKNNTFFRFLLLHKTLIIIFIMVLQDSKVTSAVFNFIFPLVYCFNLLTTLPFYNLLILKLSSCFTAIYLALSFILMIVSFGVPSKYMEIMSVIIGIFITKACFVSIDRYLVRILRLDFRNPQEAAHILVLLRKYTSSYSDVTKLEEKYKEGSIHLYGLMKMNNIEAANVKEFSTFPEYETQLYTVVINKLNEVLKRYPKSELLVILIAQIYIKKLKNAARAITLLTQFESSGASLQANVAIKHMYSKLERIYSKVHSDEELELLKYFKHRDHANKLKDMIQEETEKHLKIWREISSENISAKSVVDQAEGAERLHRQITRMWNQTARNLDKNFIAPMLLYGAYLDIVRKDGYSARQVIERYQDLRKAKSSSTAKKDTSPFSEDVAVILASIEIENCGVVVDVSSSVHDMFNISKDKLIGQKIDLLLPRVTAKKHDMMIKRYSKKTNQDLNSHFGTYAKTVDGHLFPIDLSLKIYPYINKGLNIIAHIKRLRKKELLLILDQNSAIIDCSEDLFDVFHLSRKDLDTLKAIDLCPDLREIEGAIQYIHGSGKDFEAIYRDDTKSIRSEEQLDFIGFNAKSTLMRKGESSAKEQTGTGTGFGTHTNTNTQEKMDETLVSQGLATYQDTRMLSQLSQSDKTTLFKRLFTHNSPTLFSTLGPKRDSAQFHAAAKQSAEEVCRKFKKGSKLDFYPKTLSKELNVSDKMEFKVVVVPYFLEGELYKLVKLKNLYLEENLQDRKEGSLPVLYETKLPTQSSEDEFAESFPDADEKNAGPVKKQNPAEKKKTLILHKNQVQLEKLQNILAYNGDQDSLGNSVAKEASTPSMLQKVYAKGAKPGDDTSSLNYSHKETRIVKALNELFDQATLRPITKIAVLIVYLVMMIVLSLAGLDYFFSSKSFTDMENGVLIVETASYRILNSLVAWQWNLVTYARSVKLRPISTTVQTAQTRTNTNTLQLMARNAELQTKLQNSGDYEITKTFFNDSISLWEPYQNRTFDSSTVDTFTATRVIAQKNFQIVEYPWAQVMDLKGDQDVLFTLNNTVNDMLVKAEEQIVITEGLIDSIIQTNQTLVLTLLIFEMVALFCVGLSLLLVVRVIMLSYQKLFRVLTRVSPDHIAHRLAELNAYNDCLDKNIESKDFSNGVETINEMPTKKAKKDAKQTLGSRYREDKFSMRQLSIHTLKSLVISLTLIAVIAGLFLFSYFSADTTFNSLQLNNQRLSITHKLGYTFDMILGMFYYSIIFQNNTEFKVRNRSPADEMDTAIEFLSAANERLLTVLPDPEEGITDPVLVTFLKTNLCQFLDASLASQCASSTKGNALGLLGLNTKYYQSTLGWVNLYRSNPTFDYAAQILVPYSTDITSDISVIPAGYQFLRTYLINDFTEKIEEQKLESLTMFVILLVSLLGSTVIIQLITIRKFKSIDIGIRKILKVVPFHIIQENRLFGFYLKNEFAKELENIKQFV